MLPEAYGQLSYPLTMGRWTWWNETTYLKMSRVQIKTFASSESDTAQLVIWDQLVVSCDTELSNDNPDAVMARDKEALESVCCCSNSALFVHLLLSSALHHDYDSETAVIDIS